jgi:hypothetical protein
MIKVADPSHLVSLGTVGSGQCGLTGSDYQYVEAGKVDLCEYHDQGDPLTAIPNDGYNRLAQRITQCRSLGKPLFVGESGIPADVNSLGQSTGTVDGTSLQSRAGFFASKMTAAFANGVVGYVLWDKQQDASNSPYNLADDGGFGIGPSSAFADPTNALTANMARTFGASSGDVRYDFEDAGIDGWTVAWQAAGLGLANSTSAAWSGSHSLALDLQGVADPAARTTTTTGAGPGTTVTYHVDVPPSAPVGLQAEAYVSDNAWMQSFGSPVDLSQGWNVLTFTVPAGIATPLQAVGIQINNPAGYAGPVYLDDVTW